MINDKWNIRTFQVTHLGRSIFHLTFHLSFVFLLALNLLASPALAMHLPTDARAINSSRVPFLSVPSVPQSTPAVQRVAAVGMTVSDVDRSVEFYSKVLSFEKVSDIEVAGEDYERLQGVFGLRMRVVSMKLGNELIELTEYLAPRGRPFPIDSRGNDRWFQHIAIITSDMEKAYAWLRENRVEHASTGPQRLPDWNKNAAGIKAFYFRDPDKHYLEILEFPDGKGSPKWFSRGLLIRDPDGHVMALIEIEKPQSAKGN